MVITVFFLYGSFEKKLQLSSSRILFCIPMTISSLIFPKRAVLDMFESDFIVLSLTRIQNVCTNHILVTNIVQTCLCIHAQICNTWVWMHHHTFEFMHTLVHTRNHKYIHSRFHTHTIKHTVRTDNTSLHEQICWTRVDSGKLHHGPKEC